MRSHRVSSNSPRASRGLREVSEDLPPGHDNPFKQADFSCCLCQPIHMPKNLVVALFFFGVVSLTIGALCLSASNSVVEMHSEYSHIGTNGTVNLEAPKKMEAPLYVYYEIKRMFQNHREYVKSVSFDQLSDVSGASETKIHKECSPASETEGKTIYPCGLIANSQYNDTLQGYFCESGVSTLQSCSLMTGDNWSHQGIAWKSDLDRFNARPLTSDETDFGYFEYNLTNIENEVFVVWMRPGNGGVVRKLYAIDKKKGLEKGESILLNIGNNFNVDSFSGTKRVVVSTMSWNGGKAPFLGIVALSFGGICIFLDIILLLVMKTYKRRTGDLSYIARKIKNERMRSQFSANGDMELQEVRFSNPRDHLEIDGRMSEPSKSRNGGTVI